MPDTLLVAFLIMCRTFVLIIWHTELDLACLSSALPDDEIFSGCFDDIHREGLKTVDR